VAARPSPAVHASAAVPIMVPATPIIRAPELDGAPPAPPIVSGPDAPAPVHVRIPAIGVDAAVGRLGLNSDGTIEVPSDPGQTGWYQNGPSPGAQGPAVIIGHVDWYTGPAVFYRLSSLRAGNDVAVSLADGSTVTFTIQRVATFPVNAFPTDQVYGATPDAELRLITCGGAFSISQRRYLSNVVVFAVLKS
jgi:sortase (surface protein transpeptidase)